MIQFGLEKVSNCTRSCLICEHHSNPTPIIAAYQKTQPQAVFEKDDDDSDDDE